MSTSLFVVPHTPYRREPVRGTRGSVLLGKHKNRREGGGVIRIVDFEFSQRRLWLDEFTFKPFKFNQRRMNNE